MMVSQNEHNGALDLNEAMTNTENNVDFLLTLLQGMATEHQTQATSLQQHQEAGDIAGIK